MNSLCRKAAEILPFAIIGLAIASTSAAAQPGNNDAATPAAVSQFQAMPRGAVPPADLEARVSKEKALAQATGFLMRANGIAPGPRPACRPEMAQFDWRSFGKVTAPARKQKCGDCWAFAAVAAYESSYLIENQETVSTTNLHASEQQALDCADARYDCGGGWHDAVLNYFKSPGEVPDKAYAYTATKGQCKTVSARPYIADSSGPVDGANIPSDALLKTAICEHGPIVAAVDSKDWDRRLPNGDYVYSRKNPNWLADYPNGVFAGRLSKPNLTMANFVSGDIDHEVLIVGWDDTLRAWIIKNSWGPDWGDGGYMKLSYGHNNLGFNASWVQARSVRNQFSAKLLNQLESLKYAFENQ